MGFSQMQGRLAHQRKDSVYRDFTIFSIKIFCYTKNAGDAGERCKKGEIQERWDSGKEEYFRSKHFGVFSLVAKRNLSLWTP